MSTSDGSLLTIAICQVVLTVAGVVSVIALIWAVRTFKKLANDKTNEVLAKVQPIMEQAKAIAEQAKETAETVSAKVDSIATKAESTASKVGETVQSVTDRFDKAMNPNVVAVAGVVTAAAKGVELFRQISKLRKEKAASKQDTPPPAA